MSATTASKTRPNLYQRMLKVAGSVSYVQKDGRIRVKTKSGQVVEYSTVSHDAITAAVRGHFIAQGVLPIPTIAEVQTHDLRTSLWVELMFVNVDDPQDSIVVRSFAHADDYGDKAPSKAYSMAVKMAYLKALMIETGENEESRTVWESDQNVIDGRQLNKLRKLIEEAQGDEATLTKYLKDQLSLDDMTALTDLPKKHYAFAESKLRLSVKKRQQENKKQSKAENADESAKN